VAPIDVPGYTWGDVLFAGNPATITDKDTTFTVNVTNRIFRDKCWLKISMGVTGDVPQGFSQTFSFIATCNGDPNSPYSLSIDYPAATEVTQAGIPTGSVCLVAENPPIGVPGYSWGEVIFANNPATIIDKDTTYTVSVSNPIRRDKGWFRIRMGVTGDIPQGYSQTFNFTATCAGDPNSSYSLSIDYPTATEVTLGGIPTGSICTIAEAAPIDVPGYTWGNVLFTGNPVVILTQGEAFPVAVENPISRDKGSLEISMSVTGDVPPGFSQAFSFTATCTGDPNSPYSLSIDYPAATEVTQTGIPTGSICSIAEVAPIDVPGYTWGDILVVGNPVTITDKDTTYTVVIENLIYLALSPLWIPGN